MPTIWAILGLKNIDNIQIINTLLHSGRNKSIDHTDEKDLTALHWTLKTGQINIARLLIKHGASVGAKDVQFANQLNQCNYLFLLKSW